jgi:hypothetical protein
MLRALHAARRFAEVTADQAAVVRRRFPGRCIRFEVDTPRARGRHHKHTQLLEATSKRPKAELELGQFYIVQGLDRHRQPMCGRIECPDGLLSIGRGLKDLLARVEWVGNSGNQSTRHQRLNNTDRRRRPHTQHAREVPDRRHIGPGATAKPQRLCLGRSQSASPGVLAGRRVQGSIQPEERRLNSPRRGLTICHVDIIQ